MSLAVLFLLVTSTVILCSAFVKVPDGYGVIVHRLGKPLGVRGPGWVTVLPLVDSAARFKRGSIGLPLSTVNVPVQGRGSVAVDWHVDYRLADPVRAFSSVSDFQAFLTGIGENVLRHLAGRTPLERLLHDKGPMQRELRSAIERETVASGIEIDGVELAVIRPVSGVDTLDSDGPDSDTLPRYANG